MKRYSYDKLHILFSFGKLCVLFATIGYVVLEIQGVVAILAVLMITYTLELYQELQTIRIDANKIHIDFKLKGKKETVDFGEIKSISKIRSSFTFPIPDGVDIETTNGKHRIYFTFLREHKKLRSEISKIQPILN